MKTHKTLVTAALFAALALLAPATGTAEVPAGQVTLEIQLMPSPFQGGVQSTDVYGSFVVTGAIEAQGTAYGTRNDSGIVSFDPLVFGTSWRVELDTGAGRIEVSIVAVYDPDAAEALPPTWTIPRGTGAYAGLTGSGDASAVYGTAIDPLLGTQTWQVDWTLTGSVGPCPLPTPTLLSATPGDRHVVLGWSDESADPAVRGYAVYRDQGSGMTFLADVGLATTYTDRYLTNGTTYCYAVAAYGESCVTPLGNTMCATPDGPPPAGVSSLRTGKWVKSGKGKNATRTFEITSSFVRGDEIVFRARVLDTETGAPIPGAVVELWVQGPETRSLTSGPSDANGYAEATWKTSAPGRKKGGGGTAPGSYSAWVTGVSAPGYGWDGAGAATQIAVE